MTTLVLLLRQLLGKLVRLCSVQERFKFTIQKLMKLVQYFRKLLDRVRGRPPSPRSPKTFSEPPCSVLPSSDTSICYSQVPPNISVLPDSPVLSNVSEPRPHLSLSLSRPNSEYLSPYSALQGREDGLRRPYAHSEPAMSLHRISSRTSSRASTRTRDSREPPSPTRSIPRAHVSAGITTFRTPTHAGESVPIHPESLQLDHNEAASSTVASSTEAPSIYPIFYTNRYERYVTMLVLISLGWRPLWTYRL